MNKSLSKIAITKTAATIRDIEDKDIGSFRNFWTEGRADTLFVPIADFLAWKGRVVRNQETNPDGISQKLWTHAFRAIAGEKHSEDTSIVVKKTVTGILLFDADFLELYLEDAELRIWRHMAMKGGQI